MQKLLYQLLFTFFCITLLTSSVFTEEPAATGETGKSSEETILATPLNPGEQFNCSVDIFYQWTPDTRADKVSSELESDKTTVKEDPAPPTEVKEFYLSLVERGKQGPATKSQLQQRIEKASAEALSHCRNSHSSSKCIEEKLRSSNTQYQLMDFQGKKTLMKSITDSCDAIAGICKGASNSEIRCEIFSSPDTPIAKAKDTAATGAPAGAGAKKAK